MSCSLFPPNTPLRTKIGVVVTAVYLLLLGLLLYAKWSDLITLDLNELGDFAAGAFGPLAFLWLILGYMQQGDELKQNTEALKLQADELANTVEQQKELVALGQQQLEREKQLALEEQIRHAAATRPKFEFKVISPALKIDDLLKLGIHCKNVGAVCSHMQVHTTTKGLGIYATPVLTQSEAWSIIAEWPAEEPFEIFYFFITYLDIAGNAGSQTVTVTEYTDGHVVHGEDDYKLHQEWFRTRFESLEEPS